MVPTQQPYQGGSRETHSNQTPSSPQKGESSQNRFVGLENIEEGNEEIREIGETNEIPPQEELEKVDLGEREK